LLTIGAGTDLSDQSILELEQHNRVQLIIVGLEHFVRTGGAGKGKEAIMDGEKSQLANRLENILKHLSVDLGVRLAGSDEERLAAEYVRRELASTGATVSIEEFPVMERRVKTEKLEIGIGNSWRIYGCSLFSGTPGTEGRSVEAPLVFFASPSDYGNPTDCGNRDLSYLRGKAVVHLGCHIESREHYRRLIDAQPAFLLMVDIRYPGAEPLADGMFPCYTRDIGAVPTVNVAYMDAWNWKRDGATSARLKVEGGMYKSLSQNVIADLPGQDRSAGMIIVGGHHDTQANSPGADDNGTGTAAVIELARLLAAIAPFRRGIRLISFGAEEQLSVGSAVYVRQHRAELSEQARFMLNFDSFGSHLGWFELVVNGPPEMSQTLLNYYQAQNLYMKLITSAVPYADHFPFVAAGIPGAYIGRSNCTAGRFFHHRSDDNIDRVSPDLMAEVIASSAELLADLAEVESLPFPITIPEDQSEQAERYWVDLFGGW
jgi:aminopeptidase YwaD